MKFAIKYIKNILSFIGFLREALNSKDYYMHTGRFQIII